MASSATFALNAALNCLRCFPIDPPFGRQGFYTLAGGPNFGEYLTDAVLQLHVCNALTGKSLPDPVWAYAHCHCYFLGSKWLVTLCISLLPSLDDLLACG